MPFRNRRELKARADQALSNAFYDPRKIMLIYMGAFAAVMLAVMTLQYFLDLGIADTGGLSGLGTRTMLETASEVVRLAATLAMPFWTAGYFCCVLAMIRGRAFGPATLLEGFRNFGPVLRLYLFRTIYTGILFIACFCLGIQLFMLTPLSAGVSALLEPFLGQEQIVLDEATLLAVEQAMLPGFLMAGLVFLVLAAPMLYNLRLAELALMDDPKAGAMAAYHRSRAMMRGNRLALFKLDLSFWWFYLLDGLALALCYADMLLPLVGIQLPMDTDLAFFLSYVLYLAAQTALYVFARNKVECTLAFGYVHARADLEQRLAELARRFEAENTEN